MINFTRRISIATMALMASVLGQEGNYKEIWDLGKQEIYNAQNGQYPGGTYRLSGWLNEKNSEEWSYYDINVDNDPPRGSDDKGDQRMDVLIQWRWQKDDGSTYSETAIITWNYNYRNPYIDILTGKNWSGLAQDMTSDIDWKVQTTGQTFTVDEVNGPSGSNFQRRSYVYQDPGSRVSQDNGSRTARFYLKRREPANKLNGLSVAFFYQNYPDNDLTPKWYNYAPAVPEDKSSGNDFSFLADLFTFEFEPTFINYYGYDLGLIWSLWAPSLFLNLVPMISGPLASITMIWLMSYQLLQPDAFAEEYPDLVLWTDEQYQQDVLEGQFLFTSITYTCMLLSNSVIWIGLGIDLLFSVINQQFIISTFTFFGFVIGYSGQLIIFFVAGIWSLFLFLGWETPDELKGLE